MSTEHHASTKFRFWELVRDTKGSRFLRVTTICFLVLHAVTSKSLPDFIIKTRCQQAGEQTPADVSCVASWGIMAEGNVVAAAAYSGHTLKNIVKGLSPGHSANTPMGVGTDG